MTSFHDDGRRSLFRVGSIFDQKELQRDNILPLELKLSKEKETNDPDDDDEEIRSSVEGNNQVTLLDGGAHCRLCGTNFVDRTEQAQHFQSDWHRYNLKLSLKRKPIINEDEFEALISEDEVSSSSSDDDECESNKALYQMRTFFRQSSQCYFIDQSSEKVYSIYKTLACNELNSDEFDSFSRRNKWIILLLSGGRFSGVVFHGDGVIVHKTFHRYTVRAKQGGSQGVRDSQQPQKAPRSAGSQLRRYNEKAMAEDIQSLLKEWQLHVDEADFIFLRCSMSHRSIFLGSGAAEGPLKKSDQRIKSIPFITKSPTFDEAKRVHKKLTAVFCHGPLNEFLVENERVVNDSIKKPTQQSIKSPKKIMKTLSLRDSDSSDEVKSTKTKATKINKQQHQTEEPNSDEPGFNLSNQIKQKIYTICKLGDSKQLEELITNSEQNVNEHIFLMDYLNRVQLGPMQQTFLHQSSLDNQKQLVKKLLEIGCDPTRKNKKGQVAFQVSADRSVRDVFMDFRAESESDVWDWNKTQIPELPTDEQKEKQAEKRRKARLLRKEREKVKKAAAAVDRQEEDEKNRYLNLSDREKRALAAERRILQSCQVNDEEKQPILSRCFLCAADITGLVPFEYSSNRFCSVKCLQEHRRNTTN